MKTSIQLLATLTLTSITALAEPEETKLPPQKGIEETKLSPLELLLSAPWTIRGSGDRKASYQVIFGKDGVATRSDTKEKWWNWEIDGKILKCKWLTSGWVNFEINDDPTKKAWRGHNRAGDYYTMTLSPSKESAKKD